MRTGGTLWRLVWNSILIVATGLDLYVAYSVPVAVSCRDAWISYGSGPCSDIACGTLQDMLMSGLSLLSRRWHVNPYDGGTYYELMAA